MSTNEAHSRNNVMAMFYTTRIPSYCVWRDEDMDGSDADRLIWWTDMLNTVNKSKDELLDATLNEVLVVIHHWIAVLSPKIETTPEYCSKRQGWHLSCDI